jgi:transposase
MGAPALPPGRYFPMHMVGYFEGLDRERGIVWRCSGSFLRGSSDGSPMAYNVPDHLRADPRRKDS